MEYEVCMIDVLFSSKTRVKLLYLFYTNPDRPFYVREITRKIDEQINSVRRELANLLSVGLITSVETDKKLFYQVDQSSHYYQPFLMLFGQTQAAESPLQGKSDLVGRFRELGSLKIALIGGKLVHGSQAPIDILLVGSFVKARVTRCMKELEQEEKMTLNYTTLSLADFTYRQQVRDRFLNDILSARHQVVYDEDSLLK
jgi:hypothetical protein